MRMLHCALRSRLRASKPLAGKTAGCQARRPLPSDPASSGQRSRLQQDMEGLLPVEKNPAGRLQLLDKVKVCNVTRQHRAPMLSRGCEEQSVVQGSAPIVSALSLQPGEDARQDAGLAPYLGIRHNGSVARSPFDDGHNLFDDLACVGVGRIK